ncbi:hypothetical protein Hdeb2414_s0026g00677411 [Helianthus debilis subsp. tardiflorus]
MLQNFCQYRISQKRCSWLCDRLIGSAEFQISHSSTWCFGFEMFDFQPHVEFLKLLVS